MVSKRNGVTSYPRWVVKGSLPHSYRVRLCYGKVSKEYKGHHLDKGFQIPLLFVLENESGLGDFK